MQYMFMWDHYNKPNQKNFNKNIKTRIFPKNLKPKSQNAWEKRKGRVLDHIPIDWSLEWAKILKGWKILMKRKGLDWEIRVWDRDIWVWAKLGRTSDIYRKTQLDKSRNKNSIDREISRRYQWQKILDKSRRYRVDRDSKELTRWIELSIERYRKKKT